MAPKNSKTGFVFHLRVHNGTPMIMDAISLPFEPLIANIFLVKFMMEKCS